MKITSVQLGNVVNIVGGGTPDRSNPNYWDGEVPWASVKDLKSCSINETTETITEEGLKNSAANLIPAGNIIVATRMALGKAAINTIEVAINQDLKAIYCKKELDSRYLLHFLNAQSDNIKSQGKGATVKGITLDVLKELEIPLLPLDEQRRISAILDKADAIRRKRQESIRLTEEFLRSSFLEMFGDPVTNPKGWVEIKIGGIAEIQGGLQVSVKRAGNPIEVPYLRVANVYRDRLKLSEIKTIFATQSEVDRLKLIVGDILFVEGHGNPNEIGRSSVWDGSIETCIHQNHLIRARVEPNIADPVYISAFLNSQGGRRQLLSFGKTTSGLNTISTSNVKYTTVLLPPIKLQNSYSTIVAKIKSSTNRYQMSLDLNQQLINSLTHRGFRGEL
ncbi:MAG: restriction endonuclease subunit S [Verrucomicrobia bacterium]|nr:restriction endonuclease subunit S [Deltaproteobacteria bacterium]